MRWMTAAVAVVTMVGLSGCGRGVSDEFADAAPADFSALSLEISGADSEGAALVSADGVQRQGLEAGPDGLALARDRVKALNDTVRSIVTPIAELALQSASTTQPGDVRVFGPRVRNGVSYRLTMKRVDQTRFGWKLEGKPEAAADDAYVKVAAGAMAKGAQPHHGRGVIGIDLDTLRTLDTSVLAQGKIFCGFAHVNNHKALVYVLRGFTHDASVNEPMSGRFVGHRLMPSRATSVRVHGFMNLKDSPTTALEHVRSRVRFVPGVGGRADIVATEGDVPAGKAYWGSACWDAQEQEGFAILRLCDVSAGPLSATCQVVATRGQLSNCQLATAAYPPENVDDEEAEPESPATDIAVPSDMPSGDGE